MIKNIPCFFAHLLNQNLGNSPPKSKTRVSTAQTVSELLCIESGIRTSRSAHRYQLLPSGYHNLDNVPRAQGINSPHGIIISLVPSNRVSELLEEIRSARYQNFSGLSQHQLQRNMGIRTSLGYHNIKEHGYQNFSVRDKITRVSQPQQNRNRTSQTRSAQRYQNFSLVGITPSQLNLSERCTYQFVNFRVGI